MLAELHSVLFSSEEMDSWNFDDVVEELSEELPKLNVGSVVLVADGGTYHDYEDWFIANNATPQQMMRWNKWTDVRNNSLGKVVLMGEHLSYPDVMLALVDIHGEYYLFNADDLRLIK